MHATTNSKRTVFTAALRMIALAIIAPALIAGCAAERDPIDRVQPNVIDKKMLAGEWYYGRTVVDVPASNGFTAVGRTDYAGLTQIRWDIQEQVLYGRRTTELIDNTDDKAKSGDKYEGEVVAAFEIESHFDIVNDYNPTTGEKLNIIGENSTDRPWHERAYMRVNWAENKVTNYHLDFEAAAVESVPYYVQETNPETGEKHRDAPHFEPDGSYFDVTSRIFAKAGTVELEGYGEIPLCWLRGEEFTECGAGEYSIRHSFLKLDPERQYEPLPYKGKATEVFGFFTSDRMTYDSKEGIRQQSKERYLTRHNLWKKWFDADGKPIPYADRELRPVVYFVNRDFPEDLKDIARNTADQYNDVFNDVVKALGHQPQGRTFILCSNNPVIEGDPAECGEVGNAPRLGDVRYSFMAYVPKYMTYGLLGLGPSNNDQETGEIISGMAYVYHHNNTAAYRTVEMLQLLNGTKDSTDYIDGVDLTEWVERVTGKKESPARTFGLDQAKHMVSRIANGWRAAYWAKERQAPTLADVAAQEQHGFRKWVEPHLEAIYRRGFSNGEKHASAGRLAQLKDTYIEDLLLDPEILLAGGAGPGMPVTEAHKRTASVARGGLGQLAKHRARMREEFAASRNMYLEEMADDALVGLAFELIGKKPEEVYELVRRTIYSAVLTHEVGHSVGLMHNFGGSDDAINYHDAYWEIRDDGKVGPRLTDPLTNNERSKKIYDHAYSSIMDYAGRYTIDGQGLGKYDRAALLFGYAQKVEVFKDHGSVPAN